MTDGREFDRQTIYRIRVKGDLESEWSNWFDGLTITTLFDGETLLTGPVADQAALHSLIGRIRDLGLPLLLVERVEDEEHPLRPRAAEAESIPTKGDEE